MSVWKEKNAAERKSYKAQILGDFASSGQSLIEYAKGKDVSAKTLSRWRLEANKKAEGFVEVALPKKAPSSNCPRSLLLELNLGAWLKFRMERA